MFKAALVPPSCSDIRVSKVDTWSLTVFVRSSICKPLSATTLSLAFKSASVHTSSPLWISSLAAATVSHMPVPADTSSNTMDMMFDSWLQQNQ